MNKKLKSAGGAAVELFMKDTLERIRRLREHGKRIARMELARAESERAQHMERRKQLEQRIEAARGAADQNSAQDLASYHSFRMRMEVASRRQEHALHQAELRVDDHRARVAEAAREAEVVKVMMEARQEAARQEDARAERAVNDEAALTAWVKQAS